MKSIFSFSFIVFLFLCGCSNTDSSTNGDLNSKVAKKTDLELSSLFGKVKCITTKQSDAKMMFGEITIVNLLEFDSIVYDKSGFIVYSKNEDFENSITNESFYEYDKYHNRIKCIVNTIQEEGIERVTIKQKYDKYMNEIEKISTRENIKSGIIDEVYSDTIKHYYRYDIDGKILTEKAGDHRIERDYNNLGYLIKETKFINDTIDYTRSYTYLNDSLLLAMTTFRNNKEVSKTEYEYDTLGRKIKERISNSYRSHVTEYRPNGEVFKITYSDGTEFISEKHKTIYTRPYSMAIKYHTPIREEKNFDQYDNILSQIWTYVTSSGNMEYIFNYEYQYDSHNNWIKQLQTIPYDREEKSYTITTRAIEYY